MRKGLVVVLACPVCKGDLKLCVEAENEGEVFSGSLYCFSCDVHYRIREGIPYLMPPEVVSGSEDISARKY